MNKLILLIILLFSISCNSQSNIIDLSDRCNYNSMNHNDGSLYKKDISNVYHPYLGTWKWTSGNREMTLTLIKQSKYHYNSGNSNYYADRLVGYYIYKENGITIIDTSGESQTVDYGISVLFDINCGGTISSSFYDVKKEKNITVSLQMLSLTNLKFEGTIDESSYHFPRAGQTATYYAGSTFPLEMVFTKQ